MCHGDNKRKRNFVESYKNMIRWVAGVFVEAHGIVDSGDGGWITFIDFGEGKNCRGQ